MTLDDIEVILHLCLHNVDILEKFIKDVRTKNAKILESHSHKVMEFFSEIWKNLHSS